MFSVLMMVAALAGPTPTNEMFRASNDEVEGPCHLKIEGKASEAPPPACAAAIAAATSAKSQAILYFAWAYSLNEKQAGIEALPNLDKALALAPNFLSAVHERGYTLNDLGFYNRGLADLDREVQLSPEASTAYSERAFSRHFLADFEGALADRLKVIALLGTHPDREGGAADEEVWLGRYAAARDRLEGLPASDERNALRTMIDRRLKYRPDGGEAKRCTLGNSSDRPAASKMVDDCSWAFDHEKDRAKRADFLTVRAVMSVVAEQDRGANIDDLRIAVALDPANPQRHINYANALVDNRRSWAARNHYDLALATPGINTRDKAMALAGRSQARFNRGDTAGAKLDAHGVAAHRAFLRRSDDCGRYRRAGGQQGNRQEFLDDRLPLRHSRRYLDQAAQIGRCHRPRQAAQMSEIAQQWRSKALVHEWFAVDDARTAILLCPTVMGVTDLERGFAADLNAKGHSVMIADLYGARFAPTTSGPRRSRRWAICAATGRGCATCWMRFWARFDRWQRRPDRRDRLLLRRAVRARPGTVGRRHRGGREFPRPARPAGARRHAPITAKVIAFHGWDDPLAHPASVVALGEELTAAGCDWQLHGYGGVGHGFTNPGATGRCRASSMTKRPRAQLGGVRPVPRRARMTAYVALLRAMNVAGTGKLPMTELKRIGEACGFANVRTFIASGNLLFDSDLAEADAQARIEAKPGGLFRQGGAGVRPQRRRNGRDRHRQSVR